MADENRVCKPCPAEAPFWSTVRKECVWMCPNDMEDVDGVCKTCADDEKMRLDGLVYTNEWSGVC